MYVQEDHKYKRKKVPRFDVKFKYCSKTKVITLPNCMGILAPEVHEFKSLLEQSHIISQVC